METQPEQGAAPAPSLNDRVASLFGASEPREQTPEQPEPQTEAPTEPVAEVQAEPETFELEYDGEKFALPKKLEKGFMQERDYTQKSQELANQRRMVETQQQQLRIAALDREFNASVGEESRQLALYEAVIADAKRANWANMSTDEVIRKKLEIDQWVEQKEAISKSIEQKRSEFQKKVQEEFSKLKMSAEETLRKRIPNWSPEVVKAINESALRDGYTQEELGNIIDPRHAITLWKAHMYDVSQQKASEAVQQAKSAQVKTPSARPMDAKTKEYLNYRKQLKNAANPGQRKAIVQDRIANIFSR